MVNALLATLIASYPHGIENFPTVKIFCPKMFHFVNRLSN